MRKVLAIILLLALISGLVACQSGGNSEMDMKNAYINQRCKNDHITAEQLSIDSYGSYRGCTVAYVNGPFAYAQALGSERVGSYVLKYSNSQRLLAYKNGKWLSMPEAYEKGWLRDQDVEQILEKHKEGRDYLYDD